MGASLSSSIILILGFANLFADGFSMAISNYFSIKSKNDLEKKIKIEDKKNELKTAFATFFAFFLAGLMPLISFVSYFDPVPTKTKTVTLFAFGMGTVISLNPLDRVVFLYIF